METDEPESNNTNKGSPSSLVPNEVSNESMDEFDKEMELFLRALHSYMQKIDFVSMIVATDWKHFGYTKTPAGIMFRYKYGNTDVKAEILVFNVGDFIKVHGYLPAEEESFTTTVNSLQKCLHANSELFDLPKPVMDVAFRMKQRARQIARLEAGLLQLPDDVIMYILKLLDIKSVLRLSAVCSILQLKCRERSLWLYFHRMRYSHIQLGPEDDPYTTIVNAEKIKKENERKTAQARAALFQNTRRNIFHPPAPNPFTPFPPPPFW